MSEVQIKVKAIDQGSAALKAVGDRVDGLEGRVKGAGAAFKGLGLAAGAAIGVLAGVGVAAGKAMQMLGEGAALELAASRFDNLAASIGTTADALTGQMATATQGMMSQAQMVGAASDIISLGLADSGDEVVRLSNLVGQLGWDMQVLTLTMANDSMLRLDALGLSMENVKAKMEELKAAGVSADEAFDLAVIEAGEEKLRLLGSAADSTAGQLQVLAAQWENVVNAFKQEFAGGVASQLSVVVGAATDAGPAIQEALGSLGGRVGRTFGGALATAAADSMYLDRRDIEEQLSDLGVSWRELGQVRREAMDNTGLKWGQIASGGQAMLEYEIEVARLIEERYRVLLNQQDIQRGVGTDWAAQQWAVVVATDAQTEAQRRQAAAMAGAQSTYRDVTAQYWEMADSQGELYGSFEYGQYVIEQQAAAVDNLAARTEAYQAKLERLWETQAAGGDAFMAQAQAEPTDRIFTPNMGTNAGALNDMIIGIADAAGVGALGLADLNIQLGELEPAAARAAVAGVVAQEAIKNLIGAWQGGEIDTTELLGSIDAVIAELQNKELPAIELEIQTKLADPMEGIPAGERRWMQQMGDPVEVPIEADLEPFQAALAQALGDITGAPSDGRTLQILAEYEAVTETLTTTIPGLVSGMPADGRTITFVPDDKAVQETITALNNTRVTVNVDYVQNNPPPIPARAAGGPVSGSSAYWVGEEGPEIFVPWTSGSIVPTHRIGDAAAGGVNLVMNFYGPTNGADVATAANRAAQRLMERVRQAGVAV